jgi:hypothetical protein
MENKMSKTGYESGRDHHTEKDPGTGDYKGNDPTTEYRKGHSPDRRAARNLIPEPGSTTSTSSKRWEH